VSANGAITLTESMRGVPAGESWVSVDSDASGRFLVAAAGRSAAVLFEGGNWDKLITVPLETLELG
jgi:hypothetical protein